MSKKQRKEVQCLFCNTWFEDEGLSWQLQNGRIVDLDYRPCTDEDRAAVCKFNERPKFKLKVVGEGFERVEDNPMRLYAMRELMRDGAAWHPDIDADGHIGREAEDLIARGVCKPPRGRAAREMRRMFQQRGRSSK